MSRRTTGMACSIEGNMSETECTESGDEDEHLHLEDVRSAMSRESDKNIIVFPYEVLTPTEVLEHMKKVVEQVNSVIGLTPTITRLLLDHFKWNSEYMLEKYFELGEEEIYRVAQVENPEKVVRTSVTGSPVASPKCGRSLTDIGTVAKQKMHNCPICYSLLSDSYLLALECGHQFCVDCWRSYLTSKIMSEGLGYICCPAVRCKACVDEDFVNKLVEDARVKTKFMQFVVNGYVDSNRLLRWCPFADCTYAIKAERVEPEAVTCKCGNSFCFGCGETWHDPARCHLLKKWLLKCNNDSETSNWIAAHTKQCPKCNVTIEKDGGCNHMICMNQACKYEFCWVCLGPWEPHGSSWYMCNRFEDEPAKAARSHQKKLRSTLSRYLFYYNRYANHIRSMQLEHKLYTTAKYKMDEMTHHNMCWVEVQFLKAAVDVLCQCRQTLTYTYVFAYYLKKNNQTIIFEDNQRDLERATELLSEYLERDITNENLDNIKQKVTDKLKYCEKRREVLLDHVHEGYEKDWWEERASEEKE